MSQPLERSDGPKPRIVPIYVAGSPDPHLEWLNEPLAPRDWGAFVRDTYLPDAGAVDVRSTESVIDWRRSSAAYMNELEQLQIGWDDYERAIDLARGSLADSELEGHPEVQRLFDSRAVDIAENKEMLDAFAQITQDEIDEIEDWIEQLTDDDR